LIRAENERKYCICRPVLPQMEENLQSFADTYGIVRTQMWKVMEQLSGEASTPTLELNEKDINTLKQWLEQE